MRACFAGCMNSEGAIEATRGVLCERCYESIDQALPEVGQVLFHLREVYGMPTRSEADGSQRVRRDPPAPLNVHALDLTHQIFWSLFETLPRSNWSPWQFLDIADAEAKIIQRNLPSMSNTIRIMSLIPLPKLIKHAKTTFPMQEKSRVTALPCPNCNKRTIYVPPSSPGSNLEVVCFDCGFRIPPEKMEFYANLAEREAAK